MPKRESPSGSPALAELAIPIAALVWRLLTRPPTGLWRDWVVVVSLFWIYTVFRRDSPGWPRWVVTVMAYLFALYVVGQLPHALSVWGPSP